MTVSVCVIAYNEEKALSGLLKDIFFQSYAKKSTELVFVDSASTDATKDIFSEFDDIKLEDLLEFIGIKESDIIPIEKEKHEEFFNKNLKLDLVTIIKDGTWGKTINC